LADEINDRNFFLTCSYSAVSGINSGLLFFVCDVFSIVLFNLSLIFVDRVVDGDGNADDDDIWVLSFGVGGGIGTTVVMVERYKDSLFLFCLSVVRIVI
jgi:hypothetical protein